MDSIWLGFVRFKSKMEDGRCEVHAKKLTFGLSRYVLGAPVDLHMIDNGKCRVPLTYVMDPDDYRHDPMRALFKVEIYIIPPSLNTLDQHNVC